MNEYNNITELAEGVGGNTTVVEASASGLGGYAFYGAGTYDPEVTGNECFGIMVSSDGVPFVIKDDVATEITTA